MDRKTRHLLDGDWREQPALEAIRREAIGFELVAASSRARNKKGLLQLLRNDCDAATYGWTSAYANFGMERSYRNVFTDLYGGRIEGEGDLKRRLKVFPFLPEIMLIGNFPLITLITLRHSPLSIYGNRSGKVSELIQGKSHALGYASRN
jgi:hypothetical protein